VGSVASASDERGVERAVEYDSYSIEIVAQSASVGLGCEVWKQVRA
jgi:hypothetical protein